MPAEEIKLAFETFGSTTAPAILLVSGLGTQMTRWPDGFCQALADRDFHVVRFDNRDAGLSTHLHHLLPPDFSDLASTLMAGRTPDIPYTLHEMAGDVVALMTSLKIEQAHVVGRSMGGMIAQILASEWPDRILSLTSIMSATGNPQMPPTDPDIMALMQTPAPDPTDAPDAFVAHRIAFARAIAGTAAPVDDQTERNLILADLHRSHDPAGTARQLAAMAAAGDRRSRLATITCPTLVIHGSEDRMIPPECGRDTANAIPGARLVVLDGMGHDVPHRHHTRIIDEIVRTARLAMSQD